MGIPRFLLRWVSHSCPESHGRYTRTLTHTGTRTGTHRHTLTHTDTLIHWYTHCYVCADITGTHTYTRSRLGLLESFLDTAARMSLSKLHQITSPVCSKWSYLRVKTKALARTFMVPISLDLLCIWFPLQQPHRPPHWSQTFLSPPSSETWTS